MRLTPVLIAILLSGATFAAEAATLEVRIEGLHGRRGHLRVAVTANEAQWAHRQPPAAVCDNDLATSASPTAVRFEAMQDLNGNGRLDFNGLHIPKGPIGSSRNPDVWRRPHFDEGVFDLPADGTRIVVILK